MRDALARLESIDNGAHFIRADLHIHSYGASRDVRDPLMTPDAIVAEALARRLSVISVTDHNVVMNVEAAIAAAAPYPNELIVIPGVEVTTADGHLLAYFPEAESARRFLGLIDVIERTKSNDGRTKMGMADVAATARSCGGLAISAHIDRDSTGFECAPGYQAWKRDIVCAPGLVGVELYDVTNIDWYSNADPNIDRQTLLRHRRNSSQCCILGTYQSSDAHTLQDFRTATRWTRLKMDELTFEAFRIALLDSSARVRAVDSVPSHYPKIIGMSLDGGYLDRQDFHLSPNMNCFFGGRGTGKSTVLSSIAGALGIDDVMDSRNDCPDVIRLWVEEASGAVSYYEKRRAQLTQVAYLDEAPDDAAQTFDVEYYPQGRLEEISVGLVDQTANLQGFLDEHCAPIDGLLREEQNLRVSLKTDRSALLALETELAALPKLRADAKAYTSRIEAAEKNNLRQVAEFKAGLEREERYLALVKAELSKYELGAIVKGPVDVIALEASIGKMLNLKASRKARADIVDTVARLNTVIESARSSIKNAALQAMSELEKHRQQLAGVHNDLRARISRKEQQLAKVGMGVGLKDLDNAIRSQARVASQIAVLEAKLVERNERRSVREQKLEELRSCWARVVEERKTQLAPINRNLRDTIDEFKVNFYYDDANDRGEYFVLIRDAMQGDYLQEEQARQLCRVVSPQDLASILKAGDPEALRAVLLRANLDFDKWSGRIVRRSGRLSARLALEETWRPPIPVLKILTKGKPAREMAAVELSDGQRHTILLTVAMLSTSAKPLLIDQPEDDLDNAFISHTIVDVLRRVKERRQVLVVTHNANIAVLGDAEQLFPMQRQGDKGVVINAGSIDRAVTRTEVERVLEGGREAFNRRARLYGFVF